MTDYNIVNWLKKHGKRNIADVAREMESQEAKIKELEAKVKELESPTVSVRGESRDLSEFDREDKE